MEERRESSKFAKDLVCGMVVNMEKAAATSTYAGKTYYFCSPGCKQKFEGNPAGYASGEVKPSKMG